MWVTGALSHRELYVRAPQLFGELHMAKADGRYRRILVTYARIDLLVLDDRGLAIVSEEQRHDMLEIVEDRHGRRATLLASQAPVEKWRHIIGDSTRADAIRDRLVNNAHKLALKRDFLREKWSGKLKRPPVAALRREPREPGFASSDAGGCVSC